MQKIRKDKGLVGVLQPIWFGNYSKLEFPIKSELFFATTLFATDWSGVKVNRIIIELNWNYTRAEDWIGLLNVIK